MKKILILIIIIICSLSLPIYGNALPTETRDDETVTNVSPEDTEMNSIIANARRTVNVFLKELNNPNTKGSDFMVKYPFDTDSGSNSSVEHIWLRDIQKKWDKYYYGTVANDPFYIQNMKYGDRVEFAIDQISDWMYIQDGYLVGGESIVYFYKQMSLQEKKNFEQNAGYKIK